MDWLKAMPVWAKGILTLTTLGIFVSAWLIMKYGTNHFLQQIAKNIWAFISSKNTWAVISWLIVVALFAALIFCVSMLIWNRFAERAPGWIATSLSILAGGAMSLIFFPNANSLFSRPHLWALWLVCCLAPAALGLWDTLRDEKTETRLFNVPVIFDMQMNQLAGMNKAQAVLGNLNLNNPPNIPYNDEINARVLIDDTNITNRISNARTEIAVYFVLRQLVQKFQLNWRASDRMIQYTPPEFATFNVWRRREILSALNSNPIIEAWPDGQEFVLPPGMMLRGESDDMRSVIFEDKHCKLMFTPLSQIGFDRNIQGLGAYHILLCQVEMNITYKAWRAGTYGTRERERRWASPMAKHLQKEYPA